MGLSSEQQNGTRVETASVAPSEASTLVNPPHDPKMQFTATGRPMQKSQFSALGNMTEGPCAQAPQMLPWKFHDEDYLTVPIPYDDDDEATKPSELVREEPTRTSFMGRLSKKMAGGGEKKREKFKMVKMTRGEYLAKWARDEDGKYVGTDPVPGKLKR